MPGRPSRRSDFIEAALDAFAEKGYEAASVAELAGRTGMSKAAFGYHFPAKDDLLTELLLPLLADLESVVVEHPSVPAWPEGIRSLLGDYLDVLIAHRPVVVWIDGDKAALRHPILGLRLDRNNSAVRRAITGGSRSRAAEVGASAVLGALWRPLRNLEDIDAARHRETLLEAAMGAAAAVRRL